MKINGVFINYAVRLVFTDLHSYNHQRLYSWDDMMGRYFLPANMAFGNVGKSQVFCCITAPYVHCPIIWQYVYALVILKPRLGLCNTNLKNMIKSGRKCSDGSSVTGLKIEPRKKGQSTQVGTCFTIH